MKKKRRTLSLKGAEVFIMLTYQDSKHCIHRKNISKYILLKKFSFPSAISLFNKKKKLPVNCTFVKNLGFYDGKDEFNNLFQVPKN